MYGTMEVLKLRWGRQGAETGNNKRRNKGKLVIGLDWAVKAYRADRGSLQFER